MLKKILLKLKEVLVVDENKRINDYLNQATDIYDLEFRMRQVDSNQRLFKY